MEDGSGIDMEPTENLYSAYEDLRRNLVDNLLDNLKQINEYDFEIKVRQLVKAMGYGTIVEGAKANQKSHDGGLDGLIMTDKLGLDYIGIQAKRNAEGKVGVDRLKSFVGALSETGITKGVFVSTSSFTKEAVEFVGKNLPVKIVLIDGEKLAELMIEYDLGVVTKDTFSIKEIDSSFFE